LVHECLRTLALSASSSQKKSISAKFAHKIVASARRQCIGQQTFSKSHAVHPREAKAISNNVNDQNLDLYSGNISFRRRGSPPYLFVPSKSGGRLLAFFSNRRGAT